MTSGQGSAIVWSAEWAVWRPESPHRTLVGHTGLVYAVAVVELNGQPMVVTGGGDNTVRVWDLATGTPAAEPLHGHTGGVRAVAVAELDGRRPVIVSGGGDRTVRVWDLASGAPVGDPWTGHTG